MSGNIEYWRGLLHRCDDDLRRMTARAEQAERDLAKTEHMQAIWMARASDWKARAEKAEAERDEAEQYANKANAALMETTARKEQGR